MWRDIARFEWQLQRREFLTWIYAAVFFFLTFGYTSSHVVDLVSARGAVSRNAPWSLAQAMAGVTAFGQIITTMIAATAVMRDAATRTQELLFATRLTKAAYLGGRYMGALAVMGMVYCAIPAGLVAGALMPWVAPGDLLPFSLSAYAHPLLLLVVPNVLLVSALFFAAGAARRSFMGILLLGLLLVTLWSTGVAVARDGASWGAMLDPFGNAALEFTTRNWSLAERQQRAIPIGGVLLANRALWLTVAAGSLAWAWHVFRFEVDIVSGRGGRALTGTVHATPNELRPFSNATPIGAAKPTAPPTARQALWVSAQWIFRWTLHERGFVTLAALGTINAAVNACRVGGASPTAGDILGGVQEHVRVFFILIATIYAGELVWRDRDVRVEALVDAQPMATGAQVAGRVLGLVAAEAVLIAPLALIALFVCAIRGAPGTSLALTLAWIGGMVFPFLVQITLLSLAVHAVLQKKVGGHVALIVGWVLAVAMDRTLELGPLVRYANLPPFSWNAATGFGGHGAQLVWVELYWCFVAASLGVVASAWWVRGNVERFGARARGAMIRLRHGHAVWFAAAALGAAACAWMAMRA